MDLSDNRNRDRQCKCKEDVLMKKWIVFSCSYLDWLWRRKARQGSVLTSMFPCPAWLSPFPRAWWLFREPMSITRPKSTLIFFFIADTGTGRIGGDGTEQPTTTDPGMVLRQGRCLARFTASRKTTGPPRTAYPCTLRRSAEELAKLGEGTSLERGRTQRA